MKIESMELREKIVACTEAHNKELQRMNELMASLAKEMKKHDVELASWTELIECETAKSSEIKCRLKLGADCDRLRDQLKAVRKQLETLRIRAEAVELTFCQLKEETIDYLSLRDFIMWEIQMLKWLKLDSLERRLMVLKTSGTVGHQLLARLIHSFSSGLEEARENLEIKILGMLRRLGVYGSSKNAVTVTAALDAIASESSSPRAVEMSRSSK